MPLLIDTLQDETLDYEQRTELEGTEYLLRIRWNTRRERWQLSITAVGGTLILAGQLVHNFIPLNRRAVGGPPGQFRAIAADRTFDSAGFTDLGGRVKLWYFTAAEVAALF